MKEELQQALRALEKNLKDIQSANETVNEVRSKADEDIKAAGEVIKRIDAELNQIEEHFKNWLASFGEATKDTLKGFEVKANEAVRKMADLNEILKAQIDASVESFSESTRLLFQKYETIWGKHNQELDRVFLKFEDLRQTIDSLKTQIDQVDFPARLNSISEEIGKIGNFQKTQAEKLEEINKKQKRDFNIVVILVSVILILQILFFFL